MNHLTVSEALKQYRSAQARVVWAERKLDRARRLKADAWIEWSDAIDREKRHDKCRAKQE